MGRVCLRADWRAHPTAARWVGRTFERMWLSVILAGNFGAARQGQIVNNVCQNAGLFTQMLYAWC